MTAENAGKFLDMGASHVIVTSYVFRDGKIDYDNLSRLKKAVGKKRIECWISAAEEERILILS